MHQIINFQSSQRITDFMEVSCIMTVKKDTLQSNEAEDSMAQNLFDRYGKGFIHSREHFFKFDKCEISPLLRNKAIEIARHFENLRQKLEQDGKQPDPYLAEEFNRNIKGKDFELSFRKAIPQTIALEMDEHDPDIVKLKLANSVPFPKIRREILESVNHIFNQSGSSVSDVVIENTFRFLPPSMKAISLLFKNRQLGIN